MNTFLHRSEDRGHAQIGWLDSKHSFSFGSWYNPKYMGVGSLRVINDDTIAAHNGFGTHPHDNMEILTCVLQGTISHKDTMGNERHIHAGEWQLMSAGTGVQHSEINNGDTPVHMLQIWVIPNVRDAEPNYQQVERDPKKSPNEWLLIAGPHDDALMHIRQDAEIKAAYLEKGHSLPVKATQKFNYVHVIEGEIDIGGQLIKAGDAYLFDEDATINANENSQFIWFDLSN
ncbi:MULTISPECIES: pirin-like bicupin family protein [unclassified Acinetobacter]|uniref:pirin family protein n=1 Tax=unclassified Acinetobacter TaxID=196816 RepID=UPI002578858A|nr:MULTISPECIES: pirin-like bicupin family protein [unclassified Acinetobacter]MDM1755995.1 pirin family protein [Acinetobacter sp. 256-1]MDM1760563.1 pirin family protein [Acinetobacter sp. 251-1]